MDLGDKRVSPETAAEEAPSADLFSQAWLFSAHQVFQPLDPENPLTIIPAVDMDEKGFVMDNGDLISAKPAFKLDDMKSWIRLQQAIHPEVDYNSCFMKKWFPQKTLPWKTISVKNWVKELKQKRKEEDRLQRAEVHAVISLAGVAAALAAATAETAELDKPKPSCSEQYPPRKLPSRDSAVASAAALIAAQCAQMAEAAGARKGQLTAAMSAAVAAATDANGILTLTAAAATSLKGAATLRGRSAGRRDASLLPIFSPEEYCGFDMRSHTASLAKGTQLLVVTPDGMCRRRSVSVVLNSDGKVVLRVKKIHAIASFGSAEESVVYALHSNRDTADSGNLLDSECWIVMRTSRGEIKLKTTDINSYKMWVMTIDRMLMLSTAVTKDY